MEIIYLWLQDFIDNKEEIEQQLSYEFKNKKIKAILTYDELMVWDMGNK